MNNVTQDPAVDDQETQDLAATLLSIDGTIDLLRRQAEGLAGDHHRLERMLAARVVIGMSNDSEYSSLSEQVVQALGGDFARMNLLVAAQRLGLIPGEDRTTAWARESGTPEQQQLVEQIEASTP